MKAIIFAFFFVFALTTFVPDGEPRDIKDVLEMIRGILESWEINKEEVEKLLICVQDLEDIQVQVEIILEEIKKLSLKDIIKLAEAIARIVSAIQQLFKDMEPCIDAAGELFKILGKFVHLSFWELVQKILVNIFNNPRLIMENLEKMMDAYEKLEYRDTGYYLGEVIELLLLKD